MHLMTASITCGRGKLFSANNFKQVIFEVATKKNGSNTYYYIHTFLFNSSIHIY